MIMIHPLSSVPFHSMVFMRSTDMPAPVSSVIARIAGEPVKKNRRWRWVSDGFSQYETTLCVTYAVPSQDHQIPRPPENGVNCNSAICVQGGILRGSPSSSRTDQGRGLLALFGPDRPGWRRLFFRGARDLFDGYLVASPLKDLERRHRWIFETGVPNIVHRTAALRREKFFQLS